MKKPQPRPARQTKKRQSKAYREAYESLGIEDRPRGMLKKAMKEIKPVTMDALKDALSKAMGPSKDGIQYYDLEAGAKFLYPVLTPLKAKKATPAKPKKFPKAAIMYAALRELYVRSKNDSYEEKVAYAALTGGKPPPRNGGLGAAWKAAVKKAKSK